jgi:hypothetical protein
MTYMGNKLYNTPGRLCQLEPHCASADDDVHAPAAALESISLLLLFISGSTACSECTRCWHEFSILAVQVQTARVCGVV